MNISLETPPSKYFVRRYQAGEITINDTTYRHSIVLTGETLITDWPVQKLEDLQTEHLKNLLTHQPEIILLGTGSTQRFPPIEILIPIQQARVGLEVMSSDAASRTFNILVSEGRHVMAALIA